MSNLKLVIQRVIRAELWADEVAYSKIGAGLIAFIGIAKGDTQKDADFLASKLITLRIFDDPAGKLNLNVSEAAGEVMLVSNFTLYGDTAKGRRPSFDRAAKPYDARRLYEYFVEKVRESRLTVATGVFQAHMRILVENDGPITLICNSPAE